MDLSDLSDQTLIGDAIALVGSHRVLTAKLVAHLAEIEERRLHLLAGYSSMFDFCQKKLGMSEGEAFRRILAARLGRRFPIVYPLLASGSVHLSTLELLRERLTDENHDELFAAVAGKAKREVQSLLAARFPRPDRPSSVRATLEPLGGARFRIEFSASDALAGKLERCRDLMSHANPSREISVVIERALDCLLEHLERKRLGKKKPERGLKNRKGKPSFGTNAVRRSGVSNAVRRSGVPNAVRREVYERDGLRCTYVAEGGRRCEARAFLELDHAVPRGLGGSDDPGNLRVRCRAHNQLAAELAFGREQVEGSRHLRRKKSTAERAPAARFDAIAPEPTPAARVDPITPEPTPQELAARQTNAMILEKVRRALRGMGFRDAEAREALATVGRQHASNEALALEAVLREALFAATAA